MFNSVPLIPDSNFFCPINSQIPLNQIPLTKKKIQQEKKKNIKKKKQKKKKKTRKKKKKKKKEKKWDIWHDLQ